MTANAEIILEERKGMCSPCRRAPSSTTKTSPRLSKYPIPTNEKGMRKVAVATGISNGAKTEILKGLTEGQQVILQ